MIINSLSVIAKLGCVVFVFLLGCTKEEPKYTKENLLALTPKEGVERMETVLGQSVGDIIPCSDYGEECQSVHRFKAHNLEFIAVEFSSIEAAQRAAKKIRAWTARNWLFDDVNNEPSLERWICKYFECHPPKGKKKTMDASERSP
jgi:hypothetical protein